MRQPEDAAAVKRDLDRHPFAEAAEALQLVLRGAGEIHGRASFAISARLRSTPQA
jgi:hypothetical protein